MENNNSEEINLLSVANSFLNFLNNNKLKILVTFLILFFVGRYYYINIIENEYESTLTAASRTLKIEDVQAIIGTLKNYLKGNEYELIASKLKISVSDAKNLISISAFELIDPKKKSENAKEIEKFMIVVKSVDYNVFEKINIPLLDYIKSTNYFKSRSELNKLKYTNITKGLDKLIKQLDTLNPRLFNNIGLKNQQSSNLFFSNPGELSESINKLIQEREKLRYEMELETDIVVIEPLNNFSFIENKNLGIFKFIWGSLAFLFSCVLVLIFNKINAKR